MKFKNKFIIVLFILIVCIQTFSFADSLDLNAKAYILAEPNTGKIICENNAYEKMYPASTTKVMTAILVLENCKLSEIVVVSQSALENIPSGYVTCNLKAGEKVSIEDLLYALMVPSANDAAYVLAEYVSGSTEKFAELMNKKAKELGCENTHFVNPNGVHDNNHYSTAYDLYLIASYAMKNETFRKLVSTTKYTMQTTNFHPEYDRTLYTTNELLNYKSKYYYPHAIGVKTGFTSQAGGCLIAEASLDGLDFISVVLKSGTTSSDSSKRFSDTKSLFEYGYENYAILEIANKGTIIETIEIANATKDTKNLNLLIEDTISAFTNKDMNNINKTVILNDNLKAPISTGDVVGTIKYNIEGTIYTSNLIAGSSVSKDYTYIFALALGSLLLITSGLLLKKLNKKRYN